MARTRKRQTGPSLGISTRKRDGGLSNRTTRVGRDELHSSSEKAKMAPLAAQASVGRCSVRGLGSLIVSPCESNTPLPSRCIVLRHIVDMNFREVGYKHSRSPAARALCEVDQGVSPRVSFRASLWHVQRGNNSTDLPSGRLARGARVPVSSWRVDAPSRRLGLRLALAPGSSGRPGWLGSGRPVRRAEPVGASRPELSGAKPASRLGSTRFTRCSRVSDRERVPALRRPRSRSVSVRKLRAITMRFVMV